MNEHYTLTTDEFYRSVCCMERIGGSFLRSLAEAARRADPDNRARIVAAFPEYFAHYLALNDGKKRPTPQEMSRAGM